MASPTHVQVLDPQTIEILRCPVTGSALRLEDGFLVAEVGGLRYPVRDGIPVLLAEEARLPAGVESLAVFKSRYANQVNRR